MWGKGERGKRPVLIPVSCMKGVCVFVFIRRVPVQTHVLCVCGSEVRCEMYISGLVMSRRHLLPFHHTVNRS